MTRRLFFLVLVGVWLPGCGGGVETPKGTPVKLTGKVTLDGTPVKDVNIIFSTTSDEIPKDYRNYSAPVGPDGTYSIEKIYPFKYTVFFSSTAPVDQSKAVADPNEGNPLRGYMDPSSPLTADVSESTKTQDFQLTPVQTM